MGKIEENFRKICEDNNIVLLGDYQSATTPIKIIGYCGHNCEKTPQRIRKSIKSGSKLLCDECRYLNTFNRRTLDRDYVLKYLRENSKKVLSTEYINIDNHMEFVCDCGNSFTRSFYQAKKSISAHGRNICQKCSKNKIEPSNMLTHDKMVLFFEENNAILLSTYRNSKTALEYVGSCGHRSYRKWNNISKSIGLYGKILCNTCCQAQNKKIQNTSKGENEIKQFIEAMGFTVLQSKRPYWAHGQKIDLQVVEKKIAIEYNGERWHSSERGKTKDYHSLKNKRADKENINLLTIFESEWKNKKEIIKSIISAKLGVFENIYHGRKTSFKQITAKEARDFFNKNHRRGGTGCSAQSYGLIVGDEIVAAMSFRKERFSKKNRIELYRYATKLNSMVIGGFSKLFKNAIKNFNNDIVSYADLRFTSINSNIYLINKFKLDRVSSPCQWYYKENTTKNLIHRMNMQKHKLEKKLDFFDSDISVEENIRLNGYVKIWDCGSAIFVFNRT